MRYSNEFYAKMQPVQLMHIQKHPPTQPMVDEVPRLGVAMHKQSIL